MPISVPVHFQGAAGRPLISHLVDLYRAGKLFDEQPAIMTAPTVQVNGLAPIPESGGVPNSSATDRSENKKALLKALRPPPLKYIWSLIFARNTGNDYDETRFTTLFDNIHNVKLFWEVMNQFPIHALKMKDSIHFFKHGVRPVWEDPRNVNGGSWTFRVPKANSEKFWEDVLVLASGEQFADVIEQGDDLCGITLSRRFNSDLITVWNRNADKAKTIDGILSVILQKISPEVKPKHGSYYYKRHSEHNGFKEAIAAAKETKKSAEEDTKIVEAETEKGEE
ncbi:MAG: hypothetical protein Q9214_007652 [Letrouitia sp. 1 TL-2023]